jgi:hypothetical protein
MQTPPLDPDIADTASSESGLTVYDEENLITYLRLLDADAEGADGREVARLVLHLDPKRKSDRARRTFESHLSRVKWMTEHGYRHLLRGVEYCGRVSRRRTAEITGLKAKSRAAATAMCGRLYFQCISAVTFSVQLHRLHSKVRTSGPSDVETTPVSIIGPWHFGHGGRSISMRLGSAMRDCGMRCAPMIRREHDTLSHRWQPGYGAVMLDQSAQMLPSSRKKEA